MESPPDRPGRARNTFMALHAPDSLEARIARWMQTGDGADAVFHEVGVVIESRRMYLTSRFGARIADEVVDDGLLKIWAAIQDGHFDPVKSFRPWLTTVLKNSCRDLGRKHRRRATAVFSDIEYESRQPDFQATSTDSPILDDDHNRRLIPMELERILAPENRLVFAIASGIADFLERTVVEHWCRECDPRLAVLDAIGELLESPLHGRQVKLAAVLRLRPATTRKRYERAAEKVAQQTTMPALRELILAGRRNASL